MVGQKLRVGATITHSPPSLVLSCAQGAINVNNQIGQQFECKRGVW